MSNDIAKVLPLAARLALASAAGIEPDAPRTESQERTNALDRTIREIRAKYPTHFQTNYEKGK